MDSAEPAGIRAYRSAETRERAEAARLSRLSLEELGALADRRRTLARQHAHGGRRQGCARAEAEGIDLRPTAVTGYDARPEATTLPYLISWSAMRFASFDGMAKPMPAAGASPASARKWWTGEITRIANAQGTEPAAQKGSLSADLIELAPLAALVEYLPFPADLQSWKTIQLVDAKPPREERFFNLKPELFRDLTTGTPVPKRRGALTKPSAPTGPAPQVAQPYIQHPSSAPQPQTPQISGTTGGIPA